MHRLKKTQGFNNSPPNGKPPNKGKDNNKHDEKDKPEEKGGRRECCKKALKFVFSHVGLCGMVIAYVVAGGFIFEHLEKTNEQQECIKAMEKYIPAENDTMNKLWDIATSFRNEEDVEYALIEFKKILQKFRDNVLELRYDGSQCDKMGEADGPGFMWSFPGALLFSVTVVTTIGYGNIAPKTFWGRLVCIAYATLGIPLMLLCLANIGDVLADIFRYIYTKVCCCGCCRRKDKNKVEKLPDPSNRDRKTPEAWKKAYNSQRGLPPPNKSGPVVVDDDEDDEEEEEEKISIPLTVTMAIIGGYIFMGALLFGVWEQWDPLKASYFCFVTISTIGFGDVVPGSANFESDEDQWKMVGAAVYMLFGMAILSMCFSLIQEEIIAKFKWVGEKIGIIEKKDEKEEDEEEGIPPSNKKKQGFSPTNKPQAFRQTPGKAPYGYPMDSKVQGYQSQPPMTKSMEAKLLPVNE